MVLSHYPILFHIEHFPNLELNKIGDLQSMPLAVPECVKPKCYDCVMDSCPRLMINIYFERILDFDAQYVRPNDLVKGHHGPHSLLITILTSAR